VEEQTAGLAAGVQAAVHAEPVQLLAAHAVDLQHLEERRDVPDVDEGDVAELPAPLHGDAYAVEEGEQPVGQVLAAVEAFIGQTPHASNRVRALGLSDYVLKRHLEVVVDVVGVAVDHVEFRHLAW